MSTSNYKILIAMLGDSFKAIVKEQYSKGFSIDKIQLKKSLDILRFFKVKTDRVQCPIEVIDTYYDKRTSGVIIAFLIYGFSIYFYEMEEFCGYLRNMDSLMVTSPNFDQDALMVLYTIPNVFIKGN